ncbi:hypothetical protein SAMN05421755_103812 [Nitrosomonas sp. Nm33]|nr:hypothetical protein SAMN05421755_103812 [Nitrosomonas sp. Nm33]
MAKVNVYVNEVILSLILLKQLIQSLLIADNYALFINDIADPLIFLTHDK